MTPTQRKIIWHLRYGPHNVSWLAEITGFSPRHMHETAYEMRQRGLVFPVGKEWALTARGWEHSRYLDKDGKPCQPRNRRIRSLGKMVSAHTVTRP